MDCKITGVSETLLIPLYARAKENQKPHSAFDDKLAVEMVAKIDYDFSKFENGVMSQHGVVARTIIFDREVNKYIQNHPDCICINIGCGLDTRYKRVDNKKITWYDLDFPDVIELRKNFISNTERYTMLPYSALDKNWPKMVKHDVKPILVTLEGILMYFKEEDVATLLNILRNNFPSCTIIMDTMPTCTAKRSNMHETIKKTDAQFSWGVDDFTEVEKLCRGLKFIDAWNLTNTMLKRLPWKYKLFTPIIRKFNNSVVMYKLSSQK